MANEMKNTRRRRRRRRPRGRGVHSPFDEASWYNVPRPAVAGAFSTESENALTNIENFQLLNQGNQRSNQLRHLFPARSTPNLLSFAHDDGCIGINGVDDFGNDATYSNVHMQEHSNELTTTNVENLNFLERSNRQVGYTPIKSQAFVLLSGASKAMATPSTTAAESDLDIFSCCESNTNLNPYAAPFIPRQVAHSQHAIVDQITLFIGGRRIRHSDGGCRTGLYGDVWPQDKENGRNQSILILAAIPSTQSQRPQGARARQEPTLTTANELQSRGATTCSAPRRRRRTRVRNNKRVVELHPSQSVVVIRHATALDNDWRANIEPPVPRVFYSHGKKVTMVDECNKVFVIDLLSAETCDAIRCVADAHLQRVEQSGEHGRSWRKLYTYTKMDLPCSDVDGLPLITNKILANVVSIICDVYGVSEPKAQLRPRSCREPHLLLYQKEHDKPAHPGVKMHYDGCHITWQAMLSDPQEYEGGGTYFRLLRKTVMLRKGQVLVHPGDLYHKGVNITRGSRNLLVCFMDGFDPRITDESNDRLDSAEYEKNLCIF